MNKVKEWRSRFGLSVDSAASIVGVSSSTIRKWEKQVVIPRPISVLMDYLYRDNRFEKKRTALDNYNERVRKHNGV